MPCAAPQRDVVRAGGGEEDLHAVGKIEVGRIASRVEEERVGGAGGETRRVVRRDEQRRRGRRAAAGRARRRSSCRRGSAPCDAGTGWLRSRTRARPARSRHARVRSRAAMVVVRRAPCRERRSRGSSARPSSARARRVEGSRSSGAANAHSYRRRNGDAPPRPCRRNSCSGGARRCSARESRRASRAPPRPRRRAGSTAFSARRSVAARPSLGHAHPDRLSARVHAGVGAAGAQRGDGLRAQVASSASSRTPCTVRSVRLPLPSAESGAVVVQHELHGALGHRVENYRRRGSVKQCDALRARRVTRA